MSFYTLMDVVNVIHRFNYTDICNKLFRSKAMSIIVVII